MLGSGGPIPGTCRKSAATYWCDSRVRVHRRLVSTPISHIISVTARRMIVTQDPSCRRTLIINRKNERKVIHSDAISSETDYLGKRVGTCKVSLQTMQKTRPLGFCSTEGQICPIFSILDKSCFVSSISSIRMEGLCVIIVHFMQKMVAFTLTVSRKSEQVSMCMKSGCQTSLLDTHSKMWESVNPLTSCFRGLCVPARGTSLNFVLKITLRTFEALS